MRINMKKTKVMTISKKGGGRMLYIALDGHKAEQVKNFQYLGSWITEDVRWKSRVELLWLSRPSTP